MVGQRQHPDVCYAKVETDLKFAGQGKGQHNTFIDHVSTCKF